MSYFNSKNHYHFHCPFCTLSKVFLSFLSTVSMSLCNIIILDNLYAFSISVNNPVLMMHLAVILVAIQKMRY